MKYCPFCGEKLRDEAVFCGNCGKRVVPLSAKKEETRKLVGYDGKTGKPIYEKPKKTVKKKPVKGKKKFPLKKRVGIIVGTVAAIGVCATAGFFLFQSPGDKFFLPQALMVERKLKTPVRTLSGKYKNGFSSDITVSADTSDLDSVDDDEATEILKNSKIGLKVKEEDGSLLLNGNLNLMGSNVLSAKGTYRKGTVGFEIPEVDDHYYVMDLNKYFDEEYGVKTTKKKTGTPVNTKDALKEVRKYYGILDKAVTKQNLNIVKNTTVSMKYIDRNEQNLFGVKVYQWKPTRGDLTLALTQAGNELENDTILQGWLDNAAPGVEEYVDPYARSNPDMSVRGLGKEVRKNASDWADEIVKNDFTWTMAKKGRNVVYINISYGDTELEFDRYEAGGEIREAYAYADKYNSAMMLNTYQKNKKNVYSGKMEFGTTDQVLKTSEQPAATLTYQNADLGKTDVFGLPYGNYDLDSPDFGNQSLEVSIHDGAGGAAHEIIIPGGWFSGNDGESLKVNVSASDKSSAQQPTGKKTDISDYSEDDLEDLFETIGDNVSEIVENALE